MTRRDVVQSVRQRFSIATIVLAISGLFVASAAAQVPGTAELYGVHESVLSHPVPVVNPFRNLLLNATYVGPSGQVLNVPGFYDGDGAGGMSGTVWRLRFMPTAVGNWTVSWTFTDGVGNGSGGFSVSDTGIPGPAQLDLANFKLLVNARGTPIHWRGYSIKHLGNLLCCDPPLALTDGTALLTSAVDPFLVAGGYNATYVSVPTGWNAANPPAGGTCNVFGTQTDCPIWGDYVYYSMRASKVFDDIIKGLHQRRIWAVGWITFGLQHNWNTLKFAANYQPLMRYFVARYGAYYNYFMWSPTWEVAEMGPEQGDALWETNLDQMMNYLLAIDPWHRLQGAHDQARTYWEDWQTILPRQQPSRSTIGPSGIGGANGNSRLGESANWDGGLNYGGVIIGAEDIWEFCSGAFGKPTNATEVRRGVVGGLFASVLPMYDELVEFDPPCGGLGNGSGEGYYKGMLDWWYSTVNYRHLSFHMLNHLTSSGSICSGIEGQEYVIYRENGGVMSLNLTGAPGTYAVTAINAVTGAQMSLGTVPGGGPLAAPSPFGAVDTLLFVKKL